MAGISLGKDQIIEVFLLFYVDGLSILEAWEKVGGREPTQEDYEEFNRKCQLMREGWVRMNQNIRGLGKEK